MRTPGPWEAIPATPRERRSKGRVFTETIGPKIAEVESSWDDARLIAAAPELLEAVKAAEAFLSSAQPDPTDKDRMTAWMLWRRTVIDELQAARGNAEGRS